MQLENQILDRLDKANGNVSVVASDLSISEGYVYRVKREKWIAPPPKAAITLSTPVDVAVAALPAAAPPTSKAFLEALIPPNIVAVTALRDGVLLQLHSYVAEGRVSDKHLVNLLKTLLSYETQNRALLRPAFGVLNDNRQITVNTLVDKLQNSDPEMLLALAGDFTLVEELDSAPGLEPSLSIT